MSRVKNAQFDRIAEMNDRKFGQVTVQMEGDDTPYIVMISKEPGDEFKLSSIYRKDAELEIDWYDNSVHSAYENVTGDIFANETNETGGLDPDSLLSEVLQFDNVTKQINEKLK